MRRSILLTGSKEHGKSTTGQMLSRDFGYVHLALADPLRWEVAEMLARQESSSLQVQAEIAAHLFKDMKRPETKEQYRPLLRWWGTEFRRARDPLYWVRKTQEIIRELPGNRPVVIDDVSFENEMEAFSDWARIRVLDPRKPIPASEHASEKGRAELPVDHTLCNDGAMAELRHKVWQLANGPLIFVGGV